MSFIEAVVNGSKAETEELFVTRFNVTQCSPHGVDDRRTPVLTSLCVRRASGSPV